MKKSTLEWRHIDYGARPEIATGWVFQTGKAKRPLGEVTQRHGERTYSWRNYSSGRGGSGYEDHIGAQHAVEVEERRFTQQWRETRPDGKVG